MGEIWGGKNESPKKPKILKTNFLIIIIIIVKKTYQFKRGLKKNRTQTQNSKEIKWKKEKEIQR